MSNLLTPEEAAAVLKLTPATVRAWAKAGRIPARRFGRLWRFDENEIKNAGKADTCPSIDTPNPLIGGYASRSAVEKFASRQARKSAPTPRNSNTNCGLATGVRLTLVRSITPGKKRGSGGSGSGPASAA